MKCCAINTTAKRWVGYKINYQLHYKSIINLSIIIDFLLAEHDLSNRYPNCHGLLEHLSNDNTE